MECDCLSIIESHLSTIKVSCKVNRSIIAVKYFHWLASPPTWNAFIQNIHVSGRTVDWRFVRHLHLTFNGFSVWALGIGSSHPFWWWQRWAWNPGPWNVRWLLYHSITVVTLRFVFFCFVFLRHGLTHITEADLKLGFYLTPSPKCTSHQTQPSVYILKMMHPQWISC